MLKRFLYLILLLYSTAQAAALPPAVTSALKQAQIPLQHTGIVVWDADRTTPYIGINSRRSFNPASTMKLVTSYAALNLLGPAYTWPTDISTDGKLHDGILDGNLYMKGYGDPSLNIERFWLLVHQLRQLGLKQINGDLIIDQSRFRLDPIGDFDDHPHHAYNAHPAALMVNFNSTTINTAIHGSEIRLTAEPLPSNTRVINQLTLDNAAPCSEWRDQIHSTWQADTRQLSISGTYPAACGDKTFAVTLGDASELVAGLFSTFWKNEGGLFNGKWHTGNTPDDAQLLMTYTSPPLVQAIYDLNKFSNNIMARNLFLSLSEADTASTAKSIGIVTDWLRQQHLDFPELVLENGAGLSRIERIAPDSMAQLLRSAYRSPFYPELASALPIVAVDGTMKKRGKTDLVAAHAHIKTGTLDNVKTMAGYVTTQAGHQVIVVFFINDPHASAGGPAQDALLEWIYQQK
ncbi:MAG: D-alanyl-D-alanine carboxypeptidase/D-alanyl-D-alanine-endopeptidase [Sulfuriferula sp.]|nr:D-alanyl-D-alanine carboxypeptidase/D-alanyl-D-alanine-endopeptidase [Sulfuriferula sp.]